MNKLITFAFLALVAPLANSAPSGSVEEIDTDFRMTVLGISNIITQ